MVPVVVVPPPVRLHDMLRGGNILVGRADDRRRQGSGGAQRSETANGDGREQKFTHDWFLLSALPGTIGIESATITSGSWLERDYRRSPPRRVNPQR
jgi:hypothetical protein